jgi:glycosyltransferase involved in cell wall biosynthesis
MRIGIDARLVYYQQAGIGQYILQLVEGLSRLSTPHQLLIFRSRKSKPLQLRGRTRQIPLWTPSHHPYESLALATELAPRRLDLLHSPDFIPPFHGGFKSVITIHDLNFLHYPDFLTPESQRYYGQIDRAVERADHIIADSHATKKDIVDLLKVAPEQITVIHLAANPVYRLITDQQEVRKAVWRYGLPTDFVIFVGTLEPRKNVPTLLRALRQLIDQGQDIHLAIIGRRGWLYEEIFNTITELKLANYVHLLENVSNEDLARLYNAARCLALPSYHEGFGLPPLEAMACGTPVVVSDRASLPEVVGDAGLLVDPTSPQELADALARVLTDSELAAQMHRRGLSRAGEFSWARAADQTMAVYERVLNV